MLLLHKANLKALMALAKQTIKQIEDKGVEDVLKTIADLDRQIEKMNVAMDGLRDENTKWLNYIQELRHKDNDLYKVEDEVYTKFAGNLLNDPGVEINLVPDEQVFNDGFISALAKA